MDMDMDMDNVVIARREVDVKESGRRVIHKWNRGEVKREKRKKTKEEEKWRARVKEKTI